MDIDYSELKFYIDVDENDLAGEWIKISGYTARIHEILANARTEKYKAKFLYEETKAKEAQDFRLNGQEKFGFSKITDSMVDEYLAMNTYVKTSYIAYVKAECDCEKLEGYVDGILSKRKALENLVQLTTLGLYSEPDTKRVK